LKDKNYAETIAAQAKKFADDNFSDEKYIQMVHGLYSDVLNARKLA
jgi:hypothetical protein